MRQGRLSKGGCVRGGLTPNERSLTKPATLSDRLHQVEPPGASSALLVIKFRFGGAGEEYSQLPRCQKLANFPKFNVRFAANTG